MYRWNYHYFFTIKNGRTLSDYNTEFNANPILYLFILCHLFGEVRNFYFRIPYWDLILHGFSAGMLGALGFVIVNFLNDSKWKNIQLSPFFVALFAFCFSITCGAIWEIYEFLADGILGTNMQKFITADGIVLIGREAVRDTMEDFIVNVLGALIITTIGYIQLKRKRRYLEKLESSKRSIFF